MAGFVPGRLPAAPAEVSPGYIKRTFMLENQPDAKIFTRSEGLEAPAPVTLLAPCKENCFRTAEQSEGWK